MRPPKTPGRKPPKKVTLPAKNPSGKRPDDNTGPAKRVPVGPAKGGKPAPKQSASAAGSALKGAIARAATKAAFVNAAKGKPKPTSTSASPANTKAAFANAASSKARATTKAAFVNAAKKQK
jgi:hypothetical protein